MTVDIYDPIVVDPSAFDDREAWNDAKSTSDQYFDAGQPMMAAACADPGIVACPACQRNHWAWGRAQRCTGCGFIFPVNWWSMFSWGCQAAMMEARGRLSGLHNERVRHHYYQYGYEHPAPNPWDVRHDIDWRAVVGDWQPGTATIE